MEKNRVKTKEKKEGKARRKYVSPAAISMEEFTLKTAVGVSPAMKKKESYIISTLF